MRPAARPRDRVRARARAPRPSLLALAALAASLLGPTGSATASERAPIPAQAVDLVLLRPLGAARLAAGAALWVPVSLVQGILDLSSAAFGSIGFPSRRDGAATRDTLDVFVVDPARYVFKRPLGENLAGD